LLSLAFCPALALVAHGCTDPGDGPVIAIELEAKENTIDGCTSCGCRTRGELSLGAERDWWVSFGQVESDESREWQPVGAASHCGVGSFDVVSSDFQRTVGVAYVTVDLAASTATAPEGGLVLETQLRARRLTGFDEGGEPVYAESIEERTLGLDGKGAITVPLLIADPRERESFGVYEVLFQLRASVQVREGPASYGKLSVSADVPAAQILLDGGVVGRIKEGRPTVLNNVLAGRREIRVRDFSGRETLAHAVVEPGATVEVAVEVLDLTSGEGEDELAPIGRNPQGHEEFWRTRDAASVVKIPAGEFLMGSPDGQGAPDERPQHRVYVSAFLIDKTEVTWRQFRKFAAAQGASLPPEPVSGSPDDYPVAFVLWDEATSYCEWVGGRLPTEAEWEKAARGPEGWKYSWGDTWDARRCNSISGGLHSPEAVGSYPGCVSPYGVLDMPGSMWEWSADFYADAYYAESPASDPRGPTSGRLRVMRGGDWMSQPDWLRTAYRAKRAPISRNLGHGFRCALDATALPQ
jgi:formylglycine-generating enzyme required for sulfatase activity